ncbi:MAG: phospholipase D-like domain-containing protein [Spirochaetota bacterium]
MIYGTQLAETVYTLMNSASERVIIVVPFIGDWQSILRIFGRKWIVDPNIDVKLLTDVRNEEYINTESIQHIRNRAEIRTLPGLHAKIYVADNRAIFTSANLTLTAFTKRYEFGILKECDAIFEQAFAEWWNSAKPIDATWKPKAKKNIGKSSRDNLTTSGLRTLWKLPAKTKQTHMFADFLDNVFFYKQFALLYEQNVARVWPNVPIFQEIDSFLNFLFHEHPKLPSKPFHKKGHQILSNQQRIRILKKYHGQYVIWLRNSEWENQTDRISKFKLFQKMLSPKNIENLTRDAILSVVKEIHSMNSLPLNRVSFMKETNNSTATIIGAWRKLLHEEHVPIEERMEECNKRLFRFGKSAIQELLSYYSPAKYPVINSNSMSGMRFFGYAVKG